jgi:hypothetical protein
VVRDLLAGLFIVVERHYGYGDLVHISAVGFEGATGTIEEDARRTTRRPTRTGDVVTNLSRDWARALVDVPLPLGVDVARAKDLLRKVGEDAFRDDTLRPGAQRRLRGRPDPVGARRHRRGVLAHRRARAPAWRDDQVPLREYPAGSAVSDEWAPVR